MKNTTVEPPHVVYVASYKHYRTGKIMVAKDYGYSVWRFLGGKKKK